MPAAHATVLSSHLEVAGGTPLVELARFARGAPARVFAKLEMHNPCGSVKDRVALALVDEAEREGRLRAGMRIIEATGGNTGIGLALVAAVRGYRLLLVMPETMSMERVRLLRQLGADVVLTAGILMDSAIRRADEMAAADASIARLNQFTSLANPEVHRRTTGPEIWRAMHGDVDVFVSAVGTGGTLVGVIQALRAGRPSVRAVAVEPATSAVLSGRPAGQHAMPGIGVGFFPPLLERDLVDEVVAVSDDDAMDCARRLARTEGILAGPSSGAALAAALQVASRQENHGRNIAALLADTGERYISSPLFAPRSA